MARDGEHILCCNCGRISPWDEFTALKSTEPDGDLALIDAGDTDPLLRCPWCLWLHRDDDSNPGIEQGTMAEMMESREGYLRDRSWAELWMGMLDE